MTEPILAISLHQPYATLIALGLKGNETRTWPTGHRGPLAICSAKKWDGHAKAMSSYFAGFFFTRLREDMQTQGFDLSFEHAKSLFMEAPRGFVICLANLVDCSEMTEADVDQVSLEEREVGGWEPGRFAWRLEDVRPLSEPLPIKGQQGLWTLTASQAEEVRARTGGTE